MMELVDAVVSFAISVGAGYVPAIISLLRKDKDLEDKIEDCFRKALNKWEVAVELRQMMHYDSLKHFGDLQNYLTDSSIGIHPKTKELLRLWVNELRSDEVCSNFIIMHKQEVSACKLNNILEVLKGELCTKVDAVLNNQKFMMENLTEIIQNLNKKSNGDSIELATNLFSLLNGVVASLIEKLKTDSADKIINELEIQFAKIINNNKDLQAEILYRKAQTLLLKNTPEALLLFHKAYQVQPTVKRYIRWEVKRLLDKKDYEVATSLVEQLFQDDSLRQVVRIAKSDNEEAAYLETPDILKNDYVFRQEVVDVLLAKREINASFLFTDKEVDLPDILTFTNLNEWLFILFFYRVKLGKFLILSFEVPQVKEIDIPRQAVNSFYDKLSNTEVRDCFPVVKCLYCYWNYICSKKDEWINEYHKVDRSAFGAQCFVFSLMEASMLILAGRYEEAFSVVVLVSENVNYILLRFVILMSIYSKKVFYLLWILDKVKSSNIKINNDVVVLIARSINRERAMETKTALVSVVFENEIEKNVLEQLCNYYDKKDVDVTVFKDSMDSLYGEMKAYGALLLATKGDIQLAFNMLRPIVNNDVRDVKQRIFLTVLSMMQEKTPELYKILVNNRNTGNECDDQLLRTEYDLDLRVADYTNAFGAISELFRRHPSDNRTFTYYLFTLGYVHPEQLKDYEEQAINIQYESPQNASMVYRAFSENGYLETAAELLYLNAKKFENYDIRTLFHLEAFSGLIASVANKEYEVAEDGNYVLCDVDGKKRFYKVSNDGGNIGKALLGAKKKELLEIKIGFELKKLKVIGIFNKYYKLASDIIREAEDGNNPELTPIKIDMEHPLESLETIMKKMSDGSPTYQERLNKAYEQYENSEIGLLQLVDDTNMLSGYYKLLFTSFKVHVNNSIIELQNMQQLSLNDAVFVLDMPTVLTFAEFTAKTGLEIKGNMQVTTVMHEYIRTANKSTIRFLDSNIYEAMRSGKLIKYSENVDLDAKEHLKRLLIWIDSHCEDIVAEKALVLMKNDERTPHKDQLFSSLSMLMDPNCYFVTDDVKIMDMLPSTNIISTETFVKLFTDTKIAEVYYEFLLRCNFLGVDMAEDFIFDEYQKMKNHEENCMVMIMQNMQENPLLLSKAVNVGLRLADSESDLNPLKVTLTKLYLMALKGCNQSMRDDILKTINQNMLFPVCHFRFVMQCILDAGTILRSNRLNQG